MKKLLLTTAACGMVFAAAPASAADGVKLDLGGYFKGYGVFANQDNNDDQNTAAIEEVETRNFDIIRDTEIHLSGETTLDNGLTVGAHFEVEADGGDTAMQESYVYFSGSWGRVNFGAEDGAAFLLQVDAPSADSNIDGIRQYIQPVNYAALTQQASAGNTGASLLLETVAGANVNFGYDQSLSGYADKFTYLSPIVSGVQIGLSYAPDLGNADDVGAGVRTTSVADTFGSSYEAALRYEGMISNIGVNFGAGYSLLDLEGENVVALGDATSDRTAWNVGLDLDMGPFGLGVIYKEDNAGEIANVVPVATLPAVVGEDEETWVFGADYTTGPFKVGVSWYTQENSFGITNLDTDRYSGGVTYTYGPGMSFRGSVGYIEHDGVGIGGVENSLYGDTVDEMNSTYVSIGTQINF